MIEELEKMSIININSIKLIKKDIKPQTLRDEICYYAKKGELIALKRGLYVTKTYFKNKGDFYEYFVANQIYQPSYLSHVAALSYYNIYAESAFEYISVTTNKTLTIKNKLGSFFYKNIKPELFAGYLKIKTDKYQFFIASKAKALFDYLWYIKHKFKTQPSPSDIENLRLNREEISNKDISEFMRYCTLSGSPKMKDISTVIKQFLTHKK